MTLPLLLHCIHVCIHVHTQQGGGRGPSHLPVHSMSHQLQCRSFHGSVDKTMDSRSRGLWFEESVWHGSCGTRMSKRGGGQNGDPKKDLHLWWPPKNIFTYGLTKVFTTGPQQGPQLHLSWCPRGTATVPWARHLTILIVQSLRKGLRPSVSWLCHKQHSFDSQFKFKWLKLKKKFNTSFIKQGWVDWK